MIHKTPRDLAQAVAAADTASDEATLGSAADNTSKITQTRVGQISMERIGYRARFNGNGPISMANDNRT
jgi:hypothetical protein